jgi:NADPH:quinone reductase-like Zn-dependent oxidoreductase
MRAMRIHEFGEPSVIRQDEVPGPDPAPGEVVVQVAATSFNPSEVGLRRGWLSSVLPVPLPYVLGYDVAGTVVGLGPGVTAPALGSAVIGRLDGGAAAEYVAAPANLLVAAPTSIPLAEAAALPLAGVTAWQAVFERADITPNQRVLVNGTGAIGRYAIQLARHAGAYVIATARPAHAGQVRQLGADEVVDHTAGPFAFGEPADVVLNFAAIDPGRLAAVATHVRPGGVLVSAATGVSHLAGAPIRVEYFVVRNAPDDLAALVKLVDAGTVRVEVAATRPLAELADVHHDAEAGQLPGKTVLRPAWS